MDNRRHISEELHLISPFLLNTGPLNPYHVPAGYFETFSLEMVSIVNEQSTKSKIFQEFVSLPYDLPAGYFDGFAESMLKKVKATEDNDPGTELNMLSEILGKLDKKMPFSTPEGYFDQLPSALSAGSVIAGETNGSLSEVPSVIERLDKKQVYTVPVNYFETLPSIMIAKVRPVEPAKVISGNFGRRVMQYAAAAVVTGALVISGFLFFNRDTTPDISISGIEQVSVEELESFVTNQPQVVPEALLTTSNNEVDEDDVRVILADFSDETLIQYVNQYTDASNQLN